MKKEGTLMENRIEAAKACIKLYPPSPLDNRRDYAARAVATALNISWDDASHMLHSVADSWNCTPNSARCLEKFFGMLDVATEKPPRHEDNTRYRGYDFCREHPKGRFVVMMGKTHDYRGAPNVVAVIDGKAYDTSLCTKECVGKYWQVDNVKETCLIL